MPSTEDWWYSCWWVWKLRTFPQFQGSKCLQGCSKTLWMGIKILWLFSVAAEDSIVVVTIGNQSGRSQFDSHQWPILNTRFIIFMFSSSGGMKFLILVDDSDSAYCFGFNPEVRREHQTIQLLWVVCFAALWDNFLTLKKPSSIPMYTHFW